MQEHTLIANSGIQIITFPLSINTQEKFKMWYHEWYDIENGEWRLDPVYELRTDDECYYYNKQKLHKGGYLSDPTIEIDVNELKSDDILPLRIEDENCPGVRGDIFSLTFSDRDNKFSMFETAPVDGGKAILLREGVPVREYDCDVSWDWNLGYAGIDFGENINFENGVRYSIQLPAGSTSALYRTDIVNEEAIVNFIGGYTEPVKPIQYTWCSLFDNHTTDVLGEVKFYYDRPIALSANPIIKLNIENENLTVKEVVPTISEENGDWVLAADFENIPLISEKGYTIIIPKGTIVSKEGDVVVNQRNVMEIGSSSGIVEIENREVSINSANGVISIGQIFKGCNIKLFSLDGTMIYNTKTSEGNVSISVPTFGVYLLSINGKTYKIAVK